MTDAGLQILAGITSALLTKAFILRLEAEKNADIEQLRADTMETWDKLADNYDGNLLTDLRDKIDEKERELIAKYFEKEYQRELKKLTKQIYAICQPREFTPERYLEVLAGPPRGSKKRLPRVRK